MRVLSSILGITFLSLFYLWDFLIVVRVRLWRLFVFLALYQGASLCSEFWVIGGCNFGLLSGSEGQNTTVTLILDARITRKISSNGETLMLFLALTSQG